MTDSPADDAGPVVVRKYGNRRLYRTDISRYVTLEELADMVRDEVDFVVQDAKSGTDITGMVLAQTVLEGEKRGLGLPVDLLRHIIRMRGDGQLAHFITDELPRLTELYLETQVAVSETLDAAVTDPMDPSEAALIAQLAAVREQLDHILDAVEELPEEEGDEQ